MDALFEGSLDEVLRWEAADHVGDISEGTSEECGGVSSTVPPLRAASSLHRQYASLYGSYPKMERRVFSTCGVCEQVFHPQVVTTHKEHCKTKSQSSPQIRKKLKSKKKPQGGASVPFPPLFKKEPGPPVLAKFSDIAPPTVGRLTPDVLTVPASETVKIEATVAATTTTTTTEATVVITSPPSPSPPPLPPPPAQEPPPIAKHKKKKSTNKGRHHDQAADNQKANPRNHFAANYKVQLRKSLVARSKKGSKDKESVEVENVGYTSIEPKPPEDSLLTSQTVSVSNHVTELPDNELHDVKSNDSSHQLERPAEPTKSLPVMYYEPVSPIFGVTPLQKENTVYREPANRVLSLPLKGYFMAIPELTSNIKYYKSHPKPTMLPTYNSRKIGGAILTSNQRLEYQRSDIQIALASKRHTTNNCKPTSYNVPTSRIMFNKVKAIKIGCKRSSTEKLNDGKQIKLSSELNGFVVHEVNDTTPAPNHCIQENINLLNMK